MTAARDPCVVDAWARVASGYADYWGPRFAPFLRDALAAFAPGAGPLAVPGCGPGVGALALAARHPERAVVASDPAAPMLALLRGAERPANLRVVEADALAVPDQVRAAGGVFSAFVLQLLPDRAAALRAWAEALAPDGVIAAMFWPRQDDADAWGRLGRAVQAVAGKPRPVWEADLVAQLPELGLRLEASRDLRHPIVYASPDEAWAQLRDACSMQVVLQRLGAERAAEVGRRWLADSGLQRTASGWVHRPVARLWLLRPTRA